MLNILLDHPKLMTNYRVRCYHYREYLNGTLSIDGKRIGGKHRKAMKRVVNKPEPFATPYNILSPLVYEG